MNIGIIGYGSMGKMLFEKFQAAGYKNVFIANRTKEKLSALPSTNVCNSYSALAAKSDIIFMCVLPLGIKDVLLEIAGAVKENALIVSLNGSVSFSSMEKILNHKMAKVIPSVTAEINRSQTLVCYNQLVKEDDKTALKELLQSIGTVIELPEKEMGMGSELVSCMPGFLASIFDVICQAAKEHTAIPENQISQMVLNTVSSTVDLMQQNKMDFADVVSRVATKGGITEVGSKVIYDSFTPTAQEMFEKTLEKRRQTTLKAEENFSK